MKPVAAATAFLLGLGFLGMGCGSGNHSSMMGPNAVGPQAGASLLSVTPSGGATGVSRTTSMVFRFGAAMASGMEQYVDLHMGDVAGRTMPMNCGWSADRTTLTCTPQGPLSPHTSYVLHLGGGMMTHAGRALDYAQYGPMMGGQWVMGGMMGGFHVGASWGMMGANWRDGNGSYGMAFNFTTA